MRSRMPSRDQRELYREDESRVRGRESARADGRVAIGARHPIVVSLVSQLVRLPEDLAAR